MNKFFYHGTDLDSVFKIFKTGGIKCRRLIEEEKIEIKRTLDVTFGPGYNGYDYISLCRIDESSLYCDSAFSVFIKNNYVLIISEDIDAIKTIDSNNKLMIEKYSKEFSQFFINNSGSKLRFSDMKDEWQIYDCIPIEKIVGIGIPIRKLKYNYNEIPDVKNLFNTASAFGLDIIDSSSINSFQVYEDGLYSSDKVKKIVYNGIVNV